MHNVISLDSLRKPFPENKHFRILSLRANDTVADEGVLPSLSTQKNYHIKIVSLKNAKHIDLCDRGNREVKQFVNEVVLDFLNKK